jgi:hypothetical protein
MPGLRLEPVIGCRFRLIERYLHFCFCKKFFSNGEIGRWRGYGTDEVTRRAVKGKTAYAIAKPLHVDRHTAAKYLQS